jgi:transcriptional regulator with GAF, ATPase, and Fis domain
MSRPRTEREELISRAFVTLADSLIDEYDVIDLLDRLAGFCVQLLPADAAGIVLGDARRELRAVAASDEAAHVMELLQLQSNEGPCLDCFQSAAPVSVADLAQASSRWPTFVAAVEQRGDFHSVHALPLRLRGRAIGALNLFGGVPGPLPELDLALGQALADVATIGILQERAIRRGEVLNEQLQSALNSRVIIEQAKGVLAQYGELAPAVAFERLRHYARSHNLKLADLARRIVDQEFNLAEILPAATGLGQPS